MNLKGLISVYTMQTTQTMLMDSQNVSTESKKKKEQRFLSSHEAMHKENISQNFESQVS